jgi:hypothetical protein
VLCIYNNFGNYNMKKSYLAILVSALVLITVCFWLFASGFSFRLVETLQIIIIIFIIGFGLFIGIRRLKSEKRGQPAEDELSKKIMQRASSLAYYISIYLWLFLMYISDKIKYELHTVIGIGILGMAVIFACCWVIISIIGLKHE